MNEKHKISPIGGDLEGAIDVQMSKCADERMRGCADEEICRCANERMRGCADEKTNQ